MCGGHNFVAAIKGCRTEESHTSVVDVQLVTKGISRCGGPTNTTVGPEDCTPQTAGVVNRGICRFNDAERCEVLCGCCWHPFGGRWDDGFSIRYRHANCAVGVLNHLLAPSSSLRIVASQVLSCRHNATITCRDGQFREGRGLRLDEGIRIDDLEINRRTAISGLGRIYWFNQRVGKFSDVRRLGRQRRRLIHRRGAADGLRCTGRHQK